MLLQHFSMHLWMSKKDSFRGSSKRKSVQRFFQEIQKVFSLKLTTDRWVDSLGSIIKMRKSGQSTNGVLAEIIDNLLSLFDITSRVTTNGVKIQMSPFEDHVKCDQKLHSLYRTAAGKLLWMSQLRDDIKCPVKELSRLVSNSQEPDIENLKHLLKYVNQTRDFNFVMIQVPAPNAQGVKVSSRLRLSATHIQIGPDVKRRDDQQAVRWSLCSQSALLRQAELRQVCRIHQQKRSSLLWLKHQWNHWRSSMSCRNSGQKDSYKRRQHCFAVKTDFSTSKTMASHLGISRKSKHVELKHLWIQDIFFQGVISLEIAGTRSTPTDMLTEFVQAAALGQHLLKFNLFKDPHLSQVRSYSMCKAAQGSHARQRRSIFKSTWCSSSRRSTRQSSTSRQGIDKRSKLHVSHWFSSRKAGRSHSQM